VYIAGAFADHVRVAHEWNTAAIAIPRIFTFDGLDPKYFTVESGAPQCV
jgi:hypothetical protein